MTGGLWKELWKTVGWEGEKSPKAPRPENCPQTAVALSTALQETKSAVRPCFDGNWRSYPDIHRLLLLLLVLYI
jgi:hypothetical protein